MDCLVVSLNQKRFARCAGEFISLMSVKETKPKKTLCAQGKPGFSSVKGFFYKTSLSCRKTLHIPVQRPPGLQACTGAVGSPEAEMQRRVHLLQAALLRYCVAFGEAWPNSFTQPARLAHARETVLRPARRRQA